MSKKRTSSTKVEIDPILSHSAKENSDIIPSLHILLFNSWLFILIACKIFYIWFNHELIFDYLIMWFKRESDDTYYFDQINKIFEKKIDFSCLLGSMWFYFPHESSQI